MCKFPDNEGKESKRLSKFDLFCCLNENVLNSLAKLEKKGKGYTTVVAHLLLNKGKRPPNIKVSELRVFTKKTSLVVDT